MTKITIPISTIENLIKIAYCDGKLDGLTKGVSSDDYLKQPNNTPASILNHWIKINETEKP